MKIHKLKQRLSLEMLKLNFSSGNIWSPLVSVST